MRYARPGPLNPENFPIREAIDDVLKMFDAARPEGIEVELALEEGLTVFADAGQLRQVLWNLVLNASEAMTAGGNLSVTARTLPEPVSKGGSRASRKGSMAGKEKARWLEIAIADDGAGIPKSKLDRIFDPFFTTKQNGSGLGLATVHRIIESHGGIVRLESELGMGTTVRIRLPQMGDSA